jgi:hypothetical protein
MVANKFATAVLLPKDEFREKVYETGFDVVALSKIYSKSCAQVMLRMGEVVQGRIFLYSALYEPTPEVGKWELTYWTGSSNADDQEANIYGAERLFSRKGKPALAGSLVDMVIKTEKPHLAQRITMIDNHEDDGLIAIAIPQFIAETMVKVVLVVMLSRDSGLLRPQIERIEPVIVEGFHRHL